MLLEVENVTRDFGGLRALDGVSLNVSAGEIRGLIGPNGSGKTTLFNVITGYYSPSRGKVSFQGRRISSRKPHQIARLGISRTFQGTRVFERRSLLDNIMAALYCRRRNLWPYLFRPVKESKDLRKAEQIIEFVGLTELRNEAAQNVPVGTRHLLEIGRTLAMEPKLILLDEPSAGLNQTEVDLEMDLIRRIRERGIGILVVEHDMKVIMSLCDSISVLDMGSKIADGTPEQIRNDPKVIESYLGAEGAKC